MPGRSVTPAEAQGISDLSGLVRAQRSVERGAAGGEASGPVCPAAGLHAADRDGHRRVRSHEDGGVQDTVLLGADQLLAIEQQQRAIACVAHLKRGNGGAARGLGHDDVVAGFVQRHPVDFF